MVDCAGCLVREAFYGSDQVVIDVIQPHSCPQSCMPYSVDRLLEVHKDMVEVLLVLQVFLTEYSKIEKLLSCALLAPCFVLQGSSSPLFRACQFFHKLVGFSCCCFSAGFLRYLGIVLQSMPSLLFSCLFFNLLVGFSINLQSYSSFASVLSVAPL